MGANNVIGPNGAIPVFNGGSDFENLNTNGVFQVKNSRGSFTGLNVNTAGTTSTVTMYDGNSAQVSITIATPGIITWPEHGKVPGDAIILEPSAGGALPSGLTAGTPVFITNDSNFTANSFAVSDTKAHALSGTNQINTTGSQSGTPTGYDVTNKIGAWSTTAQNGIPTGYAFAEGLIAITAGGAAADITVGYI